MAGKRGILHSSIITEHDIHFEIVRQCDHTANLPPTYLLKIDGEGLRIGRRLMGDERRADFKFSDFLDAGDDFFVLRKK